MSSRDFFDMYFDYVGETESPMIFHRWSIITSVAASLGRRGYVQLGHYKIWPNMFSMLVGVSGCRKDSALNIAKALMKESGYNKFSSNKTSKEKFVSDLCDRNHLADDTDTRDLIQEIMDCKVSNTTSKPAECFIALGEFSDFLGQNNIDFITMLGALWDVPEQYEHRIKTGKSPFVDRPIISILGGSTPTGFSLTFPPDIIGQGFLSRLLLIYGEPTGKRIAWPSRPSLDGNLVDRLKHIRTIPNESELTVQPDAKKLIGQIYNNNVAVNDPRFSSYQSRRHVHLLKLCGALSCLNMDNNSCMGDITKDNVIEANTILHYTETRMPLALGEFGRGKNADVSNLIMEELVRAHDPVSIQQLWRIVGHDLNTMMDLNSIMSGLISTEKVQVVVVGNKNLFLPNHKKAASYKAEFLNKDILTDEERVTCGF